MNKNNKNILTIAIPTYNRNKILEENLELLLPQLNDNCNLLIIDNKSEKSVEYDLKELLNKYSDKRVKIITNKYNLGLTCNIIKCFEHCNGDWLWILGDDDKVKDDALKKILDDIQDNKDKVFISYAWDEPSFKRSGNVITNGVDELIDTMESLGVILFISTSVYNLKKVVNNITYGSFFQTSYAPHLVILFMSLRTGGECMLSNKQIVINDSANTPQELKWDQIFIYQLVLLLRLPLDSRTLYKLKLRLEELTRLWTISHLIYTLTFNKKSLGNNGRPITLYNDIVKSFYYLDSRLSTKLISIVGIIIIKYPEFFKPLLLWLFKIIRRRNFELNNNLRI